MLPKGPLPRPNFRTQFSRPNNPFHHGSLCSCDAGLISAAGPRPNPELLLCDKQRTLPPSLSTGELGAGPNVTGS